MYIPQGCPFIIPPKKVVLYFVLSYSIDLVSTLANPIKCAVESIPKFSNEEALKFEMWMKSKMKNTG